MISNAIIIFFFTSATLAIAPGPDNIFVLTQSVLHGKKAGIVITTGLCTGLLIHTLLVVLGIAAIIQTSPLAFSALKIIGAVYLLYLAWRAIKAMPLAIGASAKPSESYGALYRRGFIMNLTNPKVAVFFLAFLPQFTNTEYDLAIPLQIVVFGGLFIVTAFFVFSSLAVGASLLTKSLLQNIKAQRTANYIIALIFCVLAVNIVLT